MTHLRALALLVAAASAAPLAAAELPLVFSDGMVLQRDQPNPVWGRSAPGATVQAKFAGTQAQAAADAEGYWRLELPAHAAGGPFELSIDDGDGSQVLHDVLVGDVWLASGQSNMEMPLAQVANAEREIAAATDPQIRHFKVPRSWDGAPQRQLAGGGWQASSPAVAGDFSAIGQFFARELRKSTGVPIGIIDSTWGGSRIEAWMDAATLGRDAGELANEAARLRAEDEQALAVTKQHLARWPADASDTGWSATALDDTDWAEIAVPGLWEGAGWAGLDGVAWYRTRFELSAAEAAAGVVLGVGRIDDSDTTWVNGHEVGTTTMQYNTPRSYAVPASALKAGTNFVAVRVVDTGGGGGVHGEPAELFVRPDGGASRSLPSRWRFRVATPRLALEGDRNLRPTLLYNAMIHPLQPYAIRGVIWYQGEANANDVVDAGKYRTLFPAMIKQWRAQWNAPALPFLWVQLAAFSSGVDTPAHSPWALLRESQSAALALPATAQALAIDVGDSHDIHPRDKQTVAHRLALGARAVAYGEAVEWRGPHDTGFAYADGEAIVTFESAGGLAVRGGGEQVQGFAVAGADRVFHPAQARLDGDRIHVSSAAVAKPVAVRYAWQDDPASADLVDRANLPAAPFRSDDW